MAAREDNRGNVGSDMSVGLRPLGVDDAEWVFESCQDPDIQRWTTIPNPYERRHAQQFVIDRAGDLAVWVIVDAASAEPLGLISIHGVDPGTGLADLGYWLVPSGRGRGATTQAIELLIAEIAAAPPDSVVGPVAELGITVAATNRASVAVAERAGFVRTDSDGATRCPDGDDGVPAIHFLRRIDR